MIADIRITPTGEPGAPSTPDAPTDVKPGAAPDWEGDPAVQASPEEPEVEPTWHDHFKAWKTTWST